MGENNEDQQQQPPPSKSSAQQRPTITLPPRSNFGESMFSGPGSGLGLGFSPGPMTLVSSFFNDSVTDDCKSFSQLLAGAMSSPANQKPVVDQSSSSFMQNRPAGLMVAAPSTAGMFSVSSGLSPTSYLPESPGVWGLLSPGQGSFGLGHQQVLAQVTAHASQSHSQMQMPTDFSSYLSSTSFAQPSFLTTTTNNHQQPPPQAPAARIATKEPSGIPHSDQKSQSSAYSETNENSNDNAAKKEQEYSQLTPENISATSDSEEVGDADTDERDEDEPNPKRRSTEDRVSEPASSHRTVSESRIIVQTTSEVDLLDDGYRWRKYGQKVVKGNPYPR
ncbi:hypothetical protein ACFE04_024525 [Oxalis oulophora]